jgi:hypothetical protein
MLFFESVIVSPPMAVGGKWRRVVDSGPPLRMMRAISSNSQAPSCPNKKGLAVPANNFPEK